MLRKIFLSKKKKNTAAAIDSAIIKISTVRLILRILSCSFVVVWVTGTPESLIFEHIGDTANSDFRIIREKNGLANKIIGVISKIVSLYKRYNGEIFFRRAGLHFAFFLHNMNLLQV